MATQRQEISAARARERLSVALAVVALLASALFGYLLLLTRRHARTLRRQETWCAPRRATRPMRWCCSTRGVAYYLPTAACSAPVRRRRRACR